MRHHYILAMDIMQSIHYTPCNVALYLLQWRGGIWRGPTHWQRTQDYHKAFTAQPWRHDACRPRQRLWSIALHGCLILSLWCKELVQVYLTVPQQRSQYDKYRADHWAIQKTDGRGHCGHHKELYSISLTLCCLFYRICRVPACHQETSSELCLIDP